MNIEVTQENLSKALGNVGRVASAKSGLSILNNILLRTDGTQLLVAATNLEIASTQLIGAKVITPGSITVPARLVGEFIQNLPKATISLSVKNNRLYITSGTNNSTINGMNDEEFPELPGIDESKAIIYTLPSNEFKTAIQQTAITASNDATRQVLTGVFWHTYKDSLYIAATDGYRLAEKRLMAVSTDIAAIIPVSTLQEVVRTLHDDIESVDVLFDDTQVRFRIGESEITSRLIDGNFPDYRGLIPFSSETSAVVEKSELQRIVKMASLFARDNGGTITLSVDIDKNSLTVQSVASEIGDNSSEITTKNTGTSGTVSLNSRYLHEVLGVIDDSTLNFSFSGKLAPTVIKSDSKQSDYIHIIMPIKS